MRLVENLTNPGQPPVDGDRVVLGSGNLRVTKIHHEPPPLAPVPPQTTFTSPELLAALLAAMDSDQALAALENPRAAAQLKLLEIRTRTIHASDPGYISAINNLQSIGALSADQAADFLQGLSQ